MTTHVLAVMDIKENPVKVHGYKNQTKMICRQNDTQAPRDKRFCSLTVKRYCFSNPCFNGGVCEETGDDFICSCVQGFRGPTCQGE